MANSFKPVSLGKLLVTVTSLVILTAIPAAASAPLPSQSTSSARGIIGQSDTAQSWLVAGKDDDKDDKKGSQWWIAGVPG